jgi:predicted phosphodiesterase
MTPARVAALYDIHGNLPALEAVLDDVAAARADLIVVGGDVVAGPMPREVLHRLAALDEPTLYVMGNGDREVLAAFDAGAAAEDIDDPVLRGQAWAAAQLDASERDHVAGFQATVSVEIEGLGPTLFCHGSPRSDTESITRLTGEGRLAPILDGVDEGVVVCGHTHQQFDRRLLGRRLVNAGAVGMPYEGRPGAFWALLGPEVELRCTSYDVAAAADRLRRSGFPEVEEVMLRESLLEPADPGAVAEYFEGQAVKPAD